MSLTFLTLLIGVFNLCLGYVVAVRLGFGPPSLMDTWEVLSAERPEASRPSHEAPALGLADRREPRKQAGAGL
ncbi:MAG: hypothetical protein ACYTG0_28335 [Planctomycetota bacterium]